MGDKQSKSAAPADAVLGGTQEGSGDVAAGTAAEPPQVNSVQGDTIKTEAPQGGLSSPGTNATGDTAQEAAIPSESEILAKLVAHLGQCEDRRMPLAEIHAKLPPSLQRMTEDSQTIVSWLSQYKDLIVIIGEPGQEQVVLDLGGGIKAASAAAQPQEPVPAVVAAPATAPIGGQAEGGPVAVHTGTDLADDESLSACTVQLRGLPFRAQVNDIKAFLGDYASALSTKDPAIRLLLNRDGRPSGFARVQFVSPEAARAAREALHRQQMGDRYVEVLACSDRAGKARQRRAVATEAAVEALENAGADFTVDSATEAVERERVLQECRDHMRTPGRQQLLLSMLGIALSPQARTYLRRLNLGLKHFLARFPNEFRVEGPKGCEQVYWCPNGIGMGPSTMEAYSAAVMGSPDAMMAEAAAMVAAWTAAGTEAQMAAQASNPLLASPTPQRTHNPHVMDTPSDWGTPGPAPLQMSTGDSSSQPGAAAASAAGAQSQMDQATAAFAASAWSGANFGWPPPWAGAWPAGWPPQDLGEAGDKGRNAAGGKQRGGVKADVPAARSHAHLHPQSHPFAHKPPTVGLIPSGTGAATAGAAPASAAMEDFNANVAAVRLRGLPFSMSVQDVLAFFAQYDVADRIADGPQAAQLLPKANGRPSGQARVQMRNRYDAEVAQAQLHNKWIGGRYIEVFVYGEETEQQANDFNAQLGYPPMDPKVGAGDATQPWPGSGFPSFPPIAFPGGFPGAPPMGAPPWAHMAAPPTVPGPGPEGSPQLGQSLDQLFSFLYEGKKDGEGAEGAGPRPDQSQRNAVQV